MGKRCPKKQFTDVACPNKDCELYGLTGQDNVTGNGTYISRGERTRRYICQHCGKAFCDHTDTFYHDPRKKEQTIDLALKMSMKGMSIETIADVLGVQSASVKRWLARAAEQCDKVNDNLMKNLDVPKIEMDELWAIVKKIVPRMKDYEDDGMWMWVAFVASCRLIIGFVIGPRKQYVADKLVKLVNKNLSEKIPVFVTDGLDFYKGALLDEYGVVKEFPRTGKRGRPKKPRIVPPGDLKYAQVVKKRKGGMLEKVEKKVIFGEDIEQSEISTTLLERQNLTFRQDNNRVSRKTIGFSKVKEWLEHQMKLDCTHFNFCRGHGGLRYKDGRGIKCKNTPAREAGITKSKWTLKELLTFRGFKIPIG